MEARNNALMGELKKRDEQIKELTEKLAEASES
jgi:hypothetical protein